MVRFLWMPTKCQLILSTNNTLRLRISPWNTSLIVYATFEHPLHWKRRERMMKWKLSYMTKPSSQRDSTTSLVDPDGRVRMLSDLSYWTWVKVCISKWSQCSSTTRGLSTRCLLWMNFASRLTKSGILVGSSTFWKRNDRQRKKRRKRNWPRRKRRTQKCSTIVEVL